MPKLTLTFLYMEREHLGKDVTCVPYYLGKALGYDVEIVSLTSATNHDFPTVTGNIRYRFLFRNGDRGNGWYKLAFFWWYLIRNARKIDILMRFHYSVPTMVETILYKALNPRGKVYVKCDTNHHIMDKFLHKKGLEKWFKQLLYRKGIGCIDVISCETSRAYEEMTRSQLPYFALGDKLVYVPNGFDEEMLRKMKLTLLPFEQKQHVIITVGRLGSEQKNTEMLLDALARTDLKDWKVYLIGPVDPDFRPVIERFFKNHPDKQNAVLFTGPVYDKRTLWEYYNRARIFVLTSRWESFGLVLTEACRFGCYLVSTDVGAARDLIDSQSCGEYVGQEDAVGLHHSLQRIINGQTRSALSTEDCYKKLSWEHVLQPVIEKLKER